jgi:hypothetical protein
MDKAQKPINSEYYTPSSEHFNGYFVSNVMRTYGLLFKFALGICEEIEEI